MKASIRLRMFQKDTGSSRMAAAGLWLAGAFWLTLLAIGMPTGLGTGLDIAAILILHTLAYLMISVMIAWFLTMVRLPLPRFYIGCLLYSAAVLYMIMRHSCWLRLDRICRIDCGDHRIVLGSRCCNQAARGSA